MSLSVGIDLGSTFSVISYVNSDGVAEVIPNSEGNRITPSVFSIDDSDNLLVGSLAVDYETNNPNNTIRLVKRKMSNGAEKCYKFDNISMSPIEISAEILKKLKNDAEEYLNQSISQAVIAVPAYLIMIKDKQQKQQGKLPD